MAVLQAYFDESGKKADNLVVTFCGVCGTRQKVRAFDDDWEGLLRHHGLDSFHMVEALRHSRPYGKFPKQSAEERAKALVPFADCINEHLELGLIQGWDVKGFREWSQIKNAQLLGSPDDPYYPAFVRGMLELCEYVKEGDYISLICDDDEETALKAYFHYRAVRRALIGIEERTVSLTFANDKHFPPLQAADFVSWLARREAQRIFFGKPYKQQQLYEYLVYKLGIRSKIDWRYIFADEKNKWK